MVADIFILERGIWDDRAGVRGIIESRYGSKMRKCVSQRNARPNPNH